MTNDETGYVYILTNPSFREDWVKIGKTILHTKASRSAILRNEIEHDEIKGE